MVIGGLRGDWYRFRTEALAGATSWSGTAKDHGLAPKIGVNYEVADGVALYANWGEGFHSNDARGVTNPVDPAPGVVEGTFKELGARFERGGADPDRGLLVEHDRERADLRRRFGRGRAERSGQAPRLRADRVLAAASTGWRSTRCGPARTRTTRACPPGENFVPGALESSGELGVSAIFPEFNAAGAAALPRPAPADRGQFAARRIDDCCSTCAPRGRRATSAGFEFYGELLNVFDSRAHDIDYFYADALPGRAARGDRRPHQPRGRAAAVQGGGEEDVLSAGQSGRHVKVP